MYNTAAQTYERPFDKLKKRCPSWVYPAFGKEKKINPAPTIGDNVEDENELDCPGKNEYEPETQTSPRLDNGNKGPAVAIAQADRMREIDLIFYTPVGKIKKTGLYHEKSGEIHFVTDDDNNSDRILYVDTLVQFDMQYLNRDLDRKCSSEDGNIAEYAKYDRDTLRLSALRILSDKRAQAEYQIDNVVDNYTRCGMGIPGTIHASIGDVTGALFFVFPEPYAGRICW